MKLSRHWAYGVLLLACASCRSDEPPPPPEVPSEQHAAAEPETPAAPEVPVPHEALPRTVVDITLGMSRADAEAKLGPLTCHENKAGFEVCNGAQEQIDEAHHVELYVHHDHVISVAYEAAAPANAENELNRLMDRYGQPSLSGMRERDKSGRLHEIYGWKDDQSLYSVRFVWREGEAREGAAQERALVNLSIALWDRKGYQLWEAEAKQRLTPTKTAAEPPEPA